MKLSTWGAFVDDNKDVWMPIFGMKHLLKLDEKGYVSYIGELTSKDNPKNCENILKAIGVGDKIYFFSRFAFELWILDKKTLNIDCYKYFDDPVQVISDIILVEDNAWVLPNSFDTPILKINLMNLKTEIIEWENKPFEGLPALIRADFDGETIYCATRKKDEVYLVSICVKNEHISFKKTDLEMINCIHANRHEYWSLGRNKKGDTLLQKYADEFEKIENQYVLQDVNIDVSGRLQYFNIVVNANLVYLIPAIATNIYVYNLESLNGRTLEIPGNLTCKGQLPYDPMFANVQLVDNVLYLFPYYYDQMIELNLQNEIININNPTSYDESLNRLIRCSNDLFHENNPFELNDFLDLLFC